MKSFLLAGVALVTLSGASLAADLPYRTAAPAPAFVAVPVFTWSGFYLGGNAGYAFGSNTARTTSTSPIPQALLAGAYIPGGAKFDKGGFTGGGQLGYNYQIGSLVVGLETDIQYVDRDETITRAAQPNPFIATTTYHSKLDYLGTVRGRIGYAFDRWMIYATGGLAYGDVTSGYALTTTTNTALVSARGATETGYAIGGGVEYAMPMFNLGSSAATIKVEYLHYDLGKRTVTTLSFGVPVFANRFKNEGDIVRAGLNWKFGGF
jgi:outer membrane immunogenic protein